jgi:chromate transporter
VSSDIPARSGPRVPRGRLLTAIAIIGLTSLGGWPAYYHDDFVERRRWLSDREYLEAAAMSNIIPGPVFTNITVFIARLLGGWPAVPLGLGLVLVPGALAMLALSYWYGLGISELPAVSAGLKGLGAATAAFTLVTAVRLIRSGPRSRTVAIVASLAFVAIGLLGVSLVLAVPCLALLGLWLAWPRRGPEGSTP